MFTVERFNDPKYSRPRYRLRSDVRLGWCNDGFTHGSYKLKRDAEKRAVELNQADWQRTHRLALANHLQYVVTDEQYNHGCYFHGKAACALGHAALLGIGGLRRESQSIRRNGSISGWVRGLANEVFGEGAYEYIFSTLIPHEQQTRTATIQRLRDFS